jgi:hypothetical protein
MRNMNRLKGDATAIAVAIVREALQFRLIRKLFVSCHARREIRLSLERPKKKAAEAAKENLAESRLSCPRASVLPFVLDRS